MYVQYCMIHNNPPTLKTKYVKYKDILLACLDLSCLVVTSKIPSLHNVFLDLVYR